MPSLLLLPLLQACVTLGMSKYLRPCSVVCTCPLVPLVSLALLPRGSPSSRLPNVYPKLVPSPLPPPSPSFGMSALARCTFEEMSLHESFSDHGAMSSARSESDRRRSQPYLTSAHGTVYYTPRHATTDRTRRPAAPPGFPAPLIQPRQRRPHSIHIISYPAGFVPRDLRYSSQPPTRQVLREQRRRDKEKKKRDKARKREEDRARKHLRRDRAGDRDRSDRKRSIHCTPALEKGHGQRVLDKLFAVFPISLQPHPPFVTTTAAPPTSRPQPSGLVILARRRSRSECGAEPRLETELFVPGPGPGASPHSSMVDAVRPHLVGHATNVTSTQRSSLISIRSGKNVTTSSVAELQKPVATGSGLTCSILLAEPNVFLTGFDHDGRSRMESHNSTALLRGKLLLDVSKNVKIKSVTLKLVGKARTEWPEGVPPLKVDMSEETLLRSQSLVFFHAINAGIWSTEYGNQCAFKLKGPGEQPSSLRNSLYSNASNVSLGLNRTRASNRLTAEELKRLSIQAVNSRSFGKGESSVAHETQVKGYKVFYPGSYEYSFELPIDHHQLETAKLQYGSVTWELQTTVERAGAFKPNVRGAKEVSIVRLPDQMSLEMTEPISISRQWEDQLHYDIIISGKSFPIGTKIPIAFKLTPLAKVQVHKLKVIVTESIEYWTNDRRVTRKDPGRKIVLLEKSAGKQLERRFQASEVRVLSGGELTPEQRHEARSSASRRRTAEAAEHHLPPVPLPAPSENLLGELDLGLETYWGSTEMEMNVQLPTCETMERDKMLRLHPDCSWKNVNVHHWIKIVMRISRLDPDDPTGRRRRHFEISIDSPFTVLDCRATQANTELPEYRGPNGYGSGQRQHMSCGCADATRVDNSQPNSSGHVYLAEQDVSPNASRHRLAAVDTSTISMVPQPAHVSGRQSRARIPSATTNLFQRLRDTPSVQHERERPMHLIRVPSYNPPAFDADEAPPSLELMTPPPNYDIIVGTPSVDGLADYFTRLAHYEDMSGQRQGERQAAGQVFDSHHGQDTGLDYVGIGQVEVMTSTDGDGASNRHRSAADGDDSDSGSDNPIRPHEGGRVNVANPRTPGGRLVPSRSWELERPVLRLDMSAVVRRNRVM